MRVSTDVVRTAAGTQGRPAIASDGNSFFAVWEQNGARSSIAGTRVSPDGAIANPAGIPIGESPGSDHNPSVIWNGTTYVVVFWTDEPYGVKLVELSRDGKVIRELQPVEGLVRRVRIAWSAISCAAVIST